MHEEGKMKSNSNFNFGVKNEIIQCMTICEIEYIDRQFCIHIIFCLNNLVVQLKWIFIKLHLWENEKSI